MSVDILNQILESLPPDNAGRTVKTASDNSVDAINQLLADVLDGDEEEAVKEAASCATNEKKTHGKMKDGPAEEKSESEDGPEEEAKEASDDTDVEPEPKVAAEDTPFEISPEAYEAAVKTAQAIHEKAAALQTQQQHDPESLKADARELLGADAMLAKIAMSEVAHAEFLATVTAAAMVDELVKIGTHLGQGNDYESMEKTAFLGRLLGRGAEAGAEELASHQAAMELAQAMQRRRLLAAAGAGAAGGGAVGVGSALLGGGDEEGGGGSYNPYGY